MIAIKSFVYLIRFQSIVSVIECRKSPLDGANQPVQKGALFENKMIVNSVVAGNDEIN